ncbi:hypothetical protein SYNPS1DRAFT_33498 [Syncephalis pseudoplumigaleata]|uniref:NAD(P)-binding protein n=1 Tax=Syncephalis pseudoplumigaleata TaxID=1712513 RepID=A0A4P9YVU7_9FUNG|nr:hypothetical protein SYNPS1DRAFT_33498 [Syncephalis pseudoplumigaleata]|eukprot:RKP23050.1 hypothetical protein SYNPS1DRAFT_33498 [Syncephalis pseudoplumigaleata]
MFSSDKQFTNDQVPDLHGKVSVVTGGNVGIGYHVALQLARRGSRVYLACRSEARAMAAIERLQADLARIAPAIESPDIRFLHLDLSSLKQVASAADKLLAAEPRIHILVNNAGILAVPYTLTADGIEAQFGVNHVGPTLFTARLFATVQASGTVDDPARIVFTSSGAHRRACPDAAHPWTLACINDRESYSPVHAYCRSKLANILTAKQFAQMAAADGAPTVLVNALHPGVVSTDIGRDTYGWFSWFWHIRYLPFAISAEDGALTTLYAVTSDEVREQGYNGEYFMPYGKVGHLIDAAQDKVLQQKLWNFTQSIISEKLSEQS